jgi:hypothetical protein
MTEISFLPNPFIVPSWDIVSHKRDIYAMIPILIEFVFHGMCSSLKINGSFPCLPHQSLLLFFFFFLPSFDEKFSAPSTHVERFKPRLVYQRRP